MFNVNLRNALKWAVNIYIYILNFDGTVPCTVSIYHFYSRGALCANIIFTKENCPNI